MSHHNGNGRRGHGIEPRTWILLRRHQRQHANNSDVCGVATGRSLVEFDSEASTPWTTGRSLIEEHEVVFVEPLSASKSVRLSLGYVAQFLKQFCPFVPALGTAQTHWGKVLLILYFEEDLRRASGKECMCHVVEGLRSNPLRPSVVAF